MKKTHSQCWLMLVARKRLLVGVIGCLSFALLTELSDSNQRLVRLAEAQEDIFFEERFDTWEVSQNGYPMPVSISSGFIHMGEPGTVSLDFLYVRSKVNPFPAVGNFRLEVGFQYTNVAVNGSGFVVLGAENQGTGLFFWQDPRGLFVADSIGGTVDTNPHIVTWDIRGNTVTTFLDGVLQGTFQLAARPSQLWFGHPRPGQIFSREQSAAVPGQVDPQTGIVLSRWWGTGVWTTFKLDFMRVRRGFPKAIPKN